MRFLSKSIALIILTCIPFFSYATQNLDTGVVNGENSIQHDYLDDIQSNEEYSVGDSGAIATKNTLYKVADSMKDILFIIATIYFLVLVLRLLFSENTEDEIGNFKKGILWITIGLFLTQIAFVFVQTFFDKGVSGNLAANFIANVINPLINMLETLAAAFFIAMAIFTYYRMVTANGEDDKVTKGKQSIIYAIIGFIIVKLAKILVVTTYGKIDCGGNVILRKCERNADLSEFSLIIVDVINWMNSFVGIIVVLMVIYAGFQLIFSAGEEDKVSKAKNIIIGIFIGLFILTANYLILTFFILPEQVI